MSEYSFSFRMKIIPEESFYNVTFTEILALQTKLLIHTLSWVWDYGRWARIT
jgi:hypothetical protein